MPIGRRSAAFPPRLAQTVPDCVNRLSLRRQAILPAWHLPSFRAAVSRRQTRHLPIRPVVRHTSLLCAARGNTYAPGRRIAKQRRSNAGLYRSVQSVGDGKKDSITYIVRRKPMSVPVHGKTTESLPSGWRTSFLPVGTSHGLHLHLPK